MRIPSGMLSTQGFLVCVKIADLECSSRHNALLAISEIIHTIPIPWNFIRNELQVLGVPRCFLFIFLEMTLIFSSLPDFYEKLTKEDGDTLGHCLCHNHFIFLLFSCSISGKCLRVREQWVHIV